jgi:hypothetical protein
VVVPATTPQQASSTGAGSVVRLMRYRDAPIPKAANALVRQQDEEAILALLLVS